MNTHPLAALIPAMSDDEYARLRDDIAANGLIDPITLYEDQVLDGRHRLRACEDTGVEPRFTPYDDDSPAQFVLSHNVHRRHLSSGQLSMVATDFLPHLEAEARERKVRSGQVHGRGQGRSANTGAHLFRTPPVRSSQRAGELVGVSHTSVERAAAIKRKDPALAEQVRNDEITIGAAYARVRDAKPINGTSPADAPAELTKRQVDLATANKRRLDKSMHTLIGMCEGLDKHLPVEKVLPVAEPDDLKFWVDTLKRSAATLRAYARRLEESAG